MQVDGHGFAGPICYCFTYENRCRLDVFGPWRTWNLACPEGLEPPTPSLEGWCSIQLSYGQLGRR
jgi:hypothetical protein